MRSRRLRLALLCGVMPLLGSPVVVVTTPPSALAAGPVAAPDPRGWRRVFAEDFAGGVVPRPCQVFDGLPAGQSAAYFRPDEAQISGGMLRLSIRRRDFDDRPYTSGGIGCSGMAQLFGRYEYRARAAPGAGVGSYMTLWPEGGTEDDVTAVEVAVTDGTGQALRMSNGYGSGVSRRGVSGEFEDGFHEYVIEWAPGGIRVLVDGVVKLSDPRASAKRRWPGFAVSTGDQDTGLPGQQALPSEFLVDWVRFYAYEPGARDLPSSGQGASASPQAGRGARSGGGTGGMWIKTILGLMGLAAIVAYVGSVSFRGNRSAHRA